MYCYFVYQAVIYSSRNNRLYEIPLPNYSVFFSKAEQHFATAAYANQRTSGRFCLTVYKIDLKIHCDIIITAPNKP